MDWYKLCTIRVGIVSESMLIHAFYMYSPCLTM